MQDLSTIPTDPKVGTSPLSLNSFSENLEINRQKQLIIDSILASDKLLKIRELLPEIGLFIKVIPDVGVISFEQLEDGSVEIGLKHPTDSPINVNSDKLESLSEENLDKISNALNTIAIEDISVPDLRGDVEIPTPSEREYIELFETINKNRLILAINHLENISNSRGIVTTLNQTIEDLKSVNSDNYNEEILVEVANNFNEQLANFELTDEQIDTIYNTIKDVNIELLDNIDVGLSEELTQLLKDIAADSGISTASSVIVADNTINGTAYISTDGTIAFDKGLYEEIERVTSSEEEKISIVRGILEHELKHLENNDTIKNAKSTLVLKEILATLAPQMESSENEQLTTRAGIEVLLNLFVHQFNSRYSENRADQVPNISPETFKVLENYLGRNGNNSDFYTTYTDRNGDVETFNLAPTITEAIISPHPLIRQRPINRNN